MRELLLLDTCALIWLAAGHADLSRTARRRIESAAQVHVSAITAWEISLKAARGDLILPLEPEEWFYAAMRQHGLSLADLTPELLMAANRLPWHHRDPADRFIIATARKLRAAVVTADKRFAACGVEVIG